MLSFVKRKGERESVRENYYNNLKSQNYRMLPNWRVLSAFIKSTTI